MRAAVERVLHDVWSHRGIAASLLYPFSLVYLAIARRRAARTTPVELPVPVVVVGNIYVGGTGKTPMAEMVVGYMSQTHRVALLSRGYGRRTKGYLEVRADSHYRDVGDEPLQIKLKFPETVVAVCEKRAEGIRRDPPVPDAQHQHRPFRRQQGAQFCRTGLDHRSVPLVQHADAGHFQRDIPSAGLRQPFARDLHPRYCDPAALCCGKPYPGRQRPLCCTKHLVCHIGKTHFSAPPACFGAKCPLCMQKVWKK